MSDSEEVMCLSCKEEIFEDDSRMVCLECEYPYHLGACSGISAKSFKARTEASKKTWRCQTCKTAKQRGSQSGNQGKEAVPDIAVMLASITKKLDALLPLRETVNGIEQSIQLLSEKYDKVQEKMNQHEGDLKDLKKRVRNIEQNGANENLNRLKQEVHELEWRSRRQNLEIHGIPASINESLIEKVNEVAKKLELSELTAHDVVAVHRLATKPDKIPGIIVRFTNQATRDVWLERRTRLKRGRDDAYLLENMTRQDRSLLWNTREWAREKKFQYTWYRNGRIFTRKADGEQAHVVRDVADLSRIAR